MSVDIDMLPLMQYANSAKSLAGFQKELEAKQAHQRQMDEAALRLNAQADAQIRLLATQLMEVQKANATLVKQAADSAKSARLSQYIALASLIVALISTLISIFK